jgi:hypothetical protein
MAGLRLNSIQEAADESSPRNEYDIILKETELTSSTRSKVAGIKSPQQLQEDDLKNMLIAQNFTNSYLHALDAMAKASHVHLDSEYSQKLGKEGLVEAISAVRRTLKPVKQVGPDFGNGFKWSGGCRAPDGRIFFAPHGSDHVRA